MRDEPPPDEEESPASGHPPPDGWTVLRELGARWRAADTLEYRSEAAMEHQGEPRWDVRIHARLRRPNRARLVFDGDRSESTRVRVSDGSFLYDRMRGRGRATIRAPLGSGGILENIAHPLETAGHSAEQFFARTPFVPPDGTRPRVSAARVRFTPSGKPSRPAYRVIIEQGFTRDTLWLDRVSFAPLRLVRRGIHGGLEQELLRETFTEFRLGATLSPALFVWSREDEAGRVR